MLKDKIKEYSAIAVSAAVIIVLAAKCFAELDGTTPNAPAAVMGACIALLLDMMVFMAAVFRESLRRTYYAYKNIALIGTMLFTFAFAVEMTVKLIIGLKSRDLTPEKVFTALAQFPVHFASAVAVIVLGICLAVGVSNIELMRREGTRLHNALGFVLALLYVGGTAAVLILARVIRESMIERGEQSGAAFIAVCVIIPMFFLLVICYLEVMFLGTVVMGWLTARRVPSYDKDYIIILGCSISKKGGLLPLLKGRVNRAVRFAWEQEIATGKSLKYVPSGGQGEDEVMSEGSAMELYLLTRGAESFEVFPEKKSRNTLENMRFSKSVIDALEPDAKIAFATTNYHILRSGMLARRAGFDAEGIAGDTKWYFWPNGFLREFVGILAMHKKAHLIVTGAILLVSIAAGIVGMKIL